MEERDYQTSKVTLITDIHFMLIFSDWLGVTQSQTANRLEVQLDYIWTVTVPIPHRLWRKGWPIIIFRGCVQFTLCFSISAQDNTSVCLTSTLNQGPSSIQILIPCHIVKASQLDVC